MGFGSTLGMALGAGAGGIAGGGAGAALGAGLGGAVGGMFDSSGAGDAAAAMQAQAEQWKHYVNGQQDAALGHVLTPSAMAAHDQALTAQEHNVRRQESLVAALDPNVIEAGKQTAQLLQGKSAPVLANLQQQRQLQRDQMIGQLKTQMGPGAETSTAGQQALMQFDQQTSNIMNGAQQEYLDKVSNMSLGGAQTLGQTLSQVDGALSAINEAGPQNKAASLIAQFTGAAAGPQQALMQTAGGQFLDKQIQSQKMQGLSQSLIGAGAAIYGNKSMQPVPPGGGTDPNQGGGTPGTGMSGANAEFKMPVMGGQFGAPQAPGFGTLGGSVAPPQVARAGGPAIPNAPSYLPFSSSYGGGSNPYPNYRPYQVPLTGGGNYMAGGM